MKTEREILDEVRQVFPNAKFWREPPLDLVAKECLVCGRVYYSRWPGSQYCGNECASAGHRQHKNPHRTRIQSLRDRCRASWQRALEVADVADAPSDFVTWLYHFEKHLAWVRFQKLLDELIQERIHRMSFEQLLADEWKDKPVFEFPTFEQWEALNSWTTNFDSGKSQPWRQEQDDAYWASAIGRLRKQAESGSEKSA
jgi:hypothetical protein